jgi:hypothetical protein
LLKEFVKNYLSETAQEDSVKTCNHVKTTEEQYWHGLRLMKEGTEKIIINISLESSTEKTTGNLSARSDTGD